MIWLNSVADLQYYNLLPGEYCYCELLLQPADLLLQGHITASYTGTPSIVVQCYTPDGVTNLGDITGLFDWFAGVAPDGSKYFNLKAKEFSGVLCAQKCFILRVRFQVGSTVLFDRYTEQYCLHNDCCLRVTSVTINGTTTEILPPGVPGATSTAPVVDNCGRPIITLKSLFDCYDSISGDFYGFPTSTTGGTAAGGPFRFEKVTHITGTVRRQPREITRQVSGNCRVQKVESARTYDLQGREMFPLWKMDEIEGMLHGNHVFVNGREYIYRGDTPFTRLYPCRDYFRLKTTLEDCPKQQIFGCSTECDAQGRHERYYGIRRQASPERYYDEAGRNIGTTKPELFNWYRVQDGVTAVEEVAAPAGTATHYTIFRVRGERYIPTFFYAGAKRADAKVYGRALSADAPDYNSLFGLPTDYTECAAPVFGQQITVEAMTCTAPTFGEVTLEQTCDAPTFGQVTIEEYRYY